MKSDKAFEAKYFALKLPGSTHHLSESVAKGVFFKPFPVISWDLSTHIGLFLLPVSSYIERRKAEQTNKQILPLFLDQELQSECPQTGLPKFMLILLFFFFFLFCSQRVGFVRKGDRERSGKEGNRNIKKKSNNLPRRANMGNKIDGLKWGEGLSRILSGFFSWQHKSARRSTVLWKQMFRTIFRSLTFLIS